MTTHGEAAKAFAIDATALECEREREGRERTGTHKRETPINKNTAAPPKIRFALRLERRRNDAPSTKDELTGHAGCWVFRANASPLVKRLRRAPPPLLLSSGLLVFRSSPPLVSSFARLRRCLPAMRSASLLVLVLAVLAVAGMSENEMSWCCVCCVVVSRGCRRKARPLRTPVDVDLDLDLDASRTVLYLGVLRVARRTERADYLLTAISCSCLSAARLLASLAWCGVVCASTAAQQCTLQLVTLGQDISSAPYTNVAPSGAGVTPISYNTVGFANVLNDKQYGTGYVHPPRMRSISLSRSLSITLPCVGAPNSLAGARDRHDGAPLNQQHQYLGGRQVGLCRLHLLGPDEHCLHRLVGAKQRPHHGAGLV